MLSTAAARGCNRRVLTAGCLVHCIRYISTLPVLQQPGRAAGSKLIADRRFDIRRYKGYPVTKMTHADGSLGDRSGGTIDPITSKCSIWRRRPLHEGARSEFRLLSSRSAVTCREMCRCGSSWPAPSGPLEAWSSVGLLLRSASVT